MKIPIKGQEVYKLKPGIKQNPILRWNLTDRVFFACGACHILAYAFLETYPDNDYKPFWIKPKKGHTGNHIFLANDTIAFDYHGYSCLENFIDHTYKKANLWWPNWTAELVELPKDALVSEEQSKKYDGLWLREPKQFLYDALPRAKEYLERFDHSDLKINYK